MSSDPSAQQAQQRVNDFLRLLPLTLEIAGLARTEHGKQFNEDQMGVRINQIKTAYRLARQLIVEVAGK